MLPYYWKVDKEKSTHPRVVLDRAFLGQGCGPLLQGGGDLEVNLVLKTGRIVQLDEVAAQRPLL